MARQLLAAHRERYGIACQFVLSQIADANLLDQCAMYAHTSETAVSSV